MKPSPLLPCFAPGEFSFDVRGELTVAAARHVPLAATSWLVDLSARRKFMVLGRRAGDWLVQRGLSVPAWFTRARGPGEQWAARIGDARYLACMGVDGACGPASEAVLVLSHASTEIALGGPAAADVLGELCTSPWTELTADAFAPVLLAQHEAYLYPQGGEWRIVCAAADAVSLFQVLRTSAEERGAAVLGYDDYLTKR